MRIVSPAVNSKRNAKAAKERRTTKPHQQLVPPGELWVAAVAAVAASE